MTTTAYDIGDNRRLQATFKDLAGANADPGTAEITILQPDGTEVNETGTVAVPDNLTNSAVGVWHYDFIPSQTGRHLIRWEGTGAVATAERTEIYIREKGTS